MQPPTREGPQEGAPAQRVLHHGHAIGPLLLGGPTAAAAAELQGPALPSRAKQQVEQVTDEVQAAAQGEARKSAPQGGILQALRRPSTEGRTVAVGSGGGWRWRVPAASGRRRDWRDGRHPGQISSCP